MSNSKKAFYLVLLTLTPFVNKGQTAINLQDYVENIDKDKSSSRIQEQTLEIDQPNFFLKTNELNLEKNGTDFSLFQTEKKDNIIFYLNKRNEIYRGLALDKSKNIGYEISSTPNGVIEYIEKPKVELLFTCWEGHEHPKEVKSSQTRRFIGNSNSAAALDLQSNPGATNLIYLDFDGEPFYPGWNFTFTVWSFSDAAIREIWEGVSEDFIGFDVNITTNRALFDAHPQANKGWAVFAEFHNTNWSGLAKLNSFGTPSPVLVHSKGQANAYRVVVASHELGHSLGLSHDGTPTGGYYQGHGEYIPIMGIGSFAVSHWSKGDYPGANNKEDDIAMMSAWLGDRADDHVTATELFNFNGNTQTSFDKNGIIELSSDLDTFKFEISILTEVDLRVASSIEHTNLDVIATLYDESGNVIVQNSPIGDRTASIKEKLSSGTYFLTIDGGGELTHTDGFDDYSSLGYYEIKGTAKEIAEQYDIAVGSVVNLGVICSDQYIPKIKVSNDGYQPISSFEVNVYVDNVFDHNQTFNTNLASGESKTFDLKSIIQTGNHTVKVEVTLLGNNEPYTLNNVKEGNFTLSEKGNLFRFETNLPSFDGSNGVIWELKNENSSTVLKESTNVLTQNNNESTVQEYCIAPGCYDFVLSGDLKLCGTTPDYAGGATYVQGDQVVVDGKIYEAKWWVSNSKPPASEWSYVKDCDMGPFTFTLDDVYNKKQITELSTTDYTGSYTETGFCSSIVTAQQGSIDLSNQISLYPNPAKDYLFVNGIDQEGTIQIMNLKGQVISQGQSKTIFVGNLASGAYLLQFINKDAVAVKKWIKK